jgi:hypothetical protein
LYRISSIQSRFTVYGSRLLDEHIKRDLKHMVQFLLEHQGQDRLAAIWLGGAYGRGEGAVFRAQDQERPWFEYELFLIYRQQESHLPREQAYHRLEASLSQHLSHAVKLRTPGDSHDISRLESRLRWYDLCLGYQVIWGDSELIPQLRPGSQLSLQTAQNLLLYWGGCLLRLEAEMEAGLNQDLGAELKDKPRFTSSPNLLDTWYRAIAALGDAWLIKLGAYHVSSLERAKRYQTWQRDSKQPWSQELGYLYQEALQYLLLPSDYEGMRSLLSTRTPDLKLLFVRVYLALFAPEASESPELEDFERFFLERQQNQQPKARQLGHLLTNLRQYRGRHFKAGWYSRPLLHRLYFLLPFLMAGEIPETFASVLPELPQDAELTAIRQAFLAHWIQVEQDLI